MLSNPAVLKLKEISKQFSPGVQSVANKLLDDVGFSTGSGSCYELSHHFGTGKLAQHTLEVVELCLQNNEYFKTLGKAVRDDLLFLSALYHDFGKVWDYASEDTRFDFNWKNTEHKRKIYHIQRSAIEFAKRVGTDLPERDQEEVLHAILSHHGRPEWGSPVTPKTKMAYLVHLSDSMSARMDDCERKEY